MVSSHLSCHQVHAAYPDALYHFSWCHQQPDQVYNHQQAGDYCRSLNNQGLPIVFEVLRIEELCEFSRITSLLSSRKIIILMVPFIVLEEICYFLRVPFSSVT